MRVPGIPTRVLLLLLVLPAVARAQITPSGDRILLKAGSMERVLSLRGGNISTLSFSVAGEEMLASPARELSVTVAREESNQAPRPLLPGETAEKNDFSSANRSRWRSEGFDPSRYDDPRPQAPRWADAEPLETRAWATLVEPPSAAITRPAAGPAGLTLTAAFRKESLFHGLSVELAYEVFEDYPVIRKSVRFRNRGPLWLRLDRLVIEDLQLSALTRKPLAAALFGAQPSVAAFEKPGSTTGLIAASEIPSALRSISDQGAMGYTPALFEWVLGPGEEFLSEPVFYFGFHGPVQTTVSSVSTPLDRAVEGPYMEFLHRHIGIAAARAPMHGPQWMTWAYFYDRIDDRLVRQLAGIAARAGFTEMLLDDGWQKDRLGTEVDTDKFPDFSATAAWIRSQGLALGLWVSCFRDRDSPDMRDMPEGRILPELIRSPKLPGLAMSFASPWRDYYTRDLLSVAGRFGVRYFKQDFTNIMYGDLAAGHESRTRKESLLRGLRGLLAAQARLRQTAPEIVNELTHEIYWGTPGVPADLAVLKSTARFHIPPNECIGSDLAREFRGRAIGPEEHAEALRRGCWLARQRFYSHRGLPLYPLEFYAAATCSHQGSLTAAIQDRQVASWLMGSPACFSGDSRTLSEEHIAHYRRRFEEVRRLQETYDIFRHFQFSGVPEPTDADWHWWGKLDEKGCGAVVIVRGSGGPPGRQVNIPWVRSGSRYRLKGLFSGKDYGIRTGRQLQEKGLPVELVAYGQELLEIAPG